MAPHRVAWLALLATGLPGRLHRDLLDQIGRGRVDPGFLAGCLTEPADPDVLALLADGFRQVRLPAGMREMWGVRLGQLGLGDRSRVRVPTLVVVAERDNVTSPRKGRALAAALGGADGSRVSLVTVPQAGHYLQMEQPALIADLIRAHAAQAAPCPEAERGGAR
jgi:pimeloyl-ACP methyl ester carboxylesterase